MNKNILINMWQSECKTTLNSKQIGFWSLKKIFRIPKEKFKKGIACDTARCFLTVIFQLKCTY